MVIEGYFEKCRINHLKRFDLILNFWEGGEISDLKSGEGGGNI